MKKYKIRKDLFKQCEFSGKKYYRIEALKDFADVKAGDRGGYVESYKNLSQDGNCWIYDEAEVKQNSRVYEDAKVYDYATVINNAKIYGNAKVYKRALVSGKSSICGKAKINKINQNYKDVTIC